MNMFASAKAMTRSDLRKAFDDYAEAHGHELAALSLLRSTGVREVSAVPQERFINGMVELVAGFSFVARASFSEAQSRVARLNKVHEALGAIRQKAFAKRGLDAKC